MANKIRISDLDFVFISYQEPNKEQNYADLLNKVPWAKRVDGVKGFDNAHKAAAEMANTDFFISVDGDNIVDEKFLLEELDFELTDPNAVHRWRAKNSINGLVYGNGGLVGWPKHTCLQMKTHENADTVENEIDFCWGVPHENMHNVYSKTVINSTADQAFIAGFREGVKMSLDRGKPVSAFDFADKIWQPNLQCLTTWMSVGADVEHGRWAMLGARVGCYQTVIELQDLNRVRDLDRIRQEFKEFARNNRNNLEPELAMYGNSLRQRLGIPIAELTSEQSQFVKFCQPNWKNKGVQERESK